MKSISYPTAAELARIEVLARRERAEYVAGLLAGFVNRIAGLGRQTRAVAEACTSARLRQA